MINRLLHLVFACIMSAAFANSLQAQGSPLLGKFSATQHQGHVNLYWQILQGNSCNGIQIYRSTDSVPFERIGYIPGICGSDFEDTNFYFTDSFPSPDALNHYYLELGTVGPSETISILVFTSNGNYRIQPHPIYNKAILLFNPVDEGEYTLRIYDIRGGIVEQLLTTEDSFELDASAATSSSSGAS